MALSERPWKDAHVVVTGASSGIGRELARQMAGEAKTLTLVARREERLLELEKELKEMRSELEVVVRPTDLTDLAECESMLYDAERAAGPVHVLVNNAGLGDIGAFDLADWSKLQRMIDLNVGALTFLSHKVYPGMVERGRGGILNISSGYGLAFTPGLGVYIGSKHYVTGLTEALHVEAAQLGVTVTQVCPGPVATEFEQVAGNFTGQKVPGWLEISAPQCARAALAGFARGRAMVIPGFAMKILMLLNAWGPRWMKRILYRPGAAWVRKRELASRI